jgi:S1-C subfamily serine protease
MVRVVVNSALRGGKVERPWLGAELQDLTSDIAKAIGRDRTAGALVASIIPGSPADKAGLKEGDIIVDVEGRPAIDTQSVLYRLATKGVGKKAKLGIVHAGKRDQVMISLITAPETVPRNITEIKGVNPFSGARVANLSPALAEEMSIDAASGVVVYETEAGSTARRLGFRPGDIVLRINQTDITNVTQLGDQLQQRVRGWEITIERGGEELQTYIGR